MAVAIAVGAGVGALMFTPGDAGSTRFACMNTCISHDFTISRSASASSGVAVSSQLRLISIQSSAYWHQ